MAYCLLGTKLSLDPKATSCWVSSRSITSVKFELKYEEEVKEMRLKMLQNVSRMFQA